MSTNQTLVSQHDFDLFAPSWQAAISNSKCITKSLKKVDIESINILKTCDKLCLALNKTSKSNYDMSQHVNDDEKHCTIRKSNIPFRDLGNIWFGTLKIYQQQVDTLFRLSRDLFSRSSNYKVKHLAASKRKSSLTSNELVKKRRFTLSGSNEKTYFSTNYSDLLEELERLTRDPMQNTAAELSQYNSGIISQFQIGKITIREISSTTYTTSDVIDDDSGFGEATHEEIAEFLNFVADNSMLNSKRTPTKRKSTCPQASPISKRCYINDSSFEPVSNENIPLLESILKASSLKRSVTPTHISNIFANHKIVENTNFLQQNCLDHNEIKKENLLTENNQFSKNVGGQKKRKKLIIDECTKIDISEIIAEMKTFNIITKTPRKRIMKSYTIKRNVTALELLTSFNRRSLKLTLSFKQKFYLSREQFERDYLNVLREIFKIDYNEKLASEIYPKWRCFEDVLQKRNKKQSVNNTIKENKFVNQTEADINNSMEVLNTNITDDMSFNECERKPNITGYNKIKSLNACIYKEWRPHGVMEKLVHLWRFNQTNKIAARTLFKLAENRIDRALGFNSLLNLSKKQFVSLTNFPKSIELQNIVMGEAIKRNKTNNIALY